MDRNNISFLQSIYLSAIAGLLSGIFTGCFIILILLFNSLQFVIETEMVLTVLGYLVAYTSILMFLTFLVTGFFFSLIGKFVFRNKILALKLFIPGAFPAVVLCSVIIPSLLFHFYNGLVNVQLLILITVTFLASVLISYKLRHITRTFLAFFAKHSAFTAGILIASVLMITVFWIRFPSIPYPGFSMEFMKGSNDTFFRIDPQTYKVDKTQPPPNIILISIETTRTDHIGVYGYERNITPNIDKFANENIRFDKCFVQSPATVVNLTALLTSAYPGETGVYEQTGILKNDFTTLTEILKNNGYSTIGIVSHNMLPDEKGTGIAQGFDYYENIGIKRKKAATYLTDKALQKLDESTGSVFLWLHYFEPHTKYNPPEEFFEKVSAMKTSNDAEKELLLVDYASRVGIKRSRISELYSPNENAKYIKKGYINDLYDAEIAYTDYEIGRVLGYLKENDRLDNSLVIITADHGESLDEHNLYTQHCLDLYTPASEVPLILKLPGDIEKNKVIFSPVNTIDIAPTILQKTNITVPSLFRGHSLLNHLADDDHKKNRDFILMTGWWDGLSVTLQKMKYRHPDFAVISNNYKFIVHSMEVFKIRNPLELVNLLRESLGRNLKPCELYNLAKDPSEMINITKNNKTLAEALRKKIYTSREFISYLSLRTKELNENTSKELTQDQIEKLKSLGYL